MGWSNDWIDAARDAGNARADKPVARGALSADVVRAAALTAVALCVPLSILMGGAAGLLHLLAVALAWAYNARLKAGVLSFLPYALAFGAVPSIVTLALPDGSVAPWWAGVAGALLGVGAHLCNVLPDLDADVKQGIRGMPHRLGARWSAVLAAVLLLAATVVLALGPAGLARGGRSADGRGRGPGDGGGFGAGPAAGVAGGLSRGDRGGRAVRGAAGRTGDGTGGGLREAPASSGVRGPVRDNCAISSKHAGAPQQHPAVGWCGLGLVRVA